MFVLENSFIVDDHYCEIELDSVSQLIALDFISRNELPQANIEQINEEFLDLEEYESPNQVIDHNNNNNKMNLNRQNEIQHNEMQLNIIQQEEIREVVIEKQSKNTVEFIIDIQKRLIFLIGQLSSLFVSQTRINLIRLSAQIVKIICSNIPIIFYFSILILFLASSFSIPQRKHLPTDSFFDWLAYFQDSQFLLYSGTISYCGSLLLLLIILWKKFGGEKISQREVIDMFLKQNPVLQYLVLAFLSSDLIPNQFDLSIWICHSFTFFAFKTSITHLEIRLQILSESIRLDSTKNSRSVLEKIRNIKILSKCIVLATMWICGISIHLFYKTGAMRLILLLFEGFFILFEQLIKLYQQHIFSVDSKYVEVAQNSIDISSDVNNESMYEPNFVFEVIFELLVHIMRLIHGYQSIRLNQVSKFTLSLLLKQLLIIATNDSIHNSIYGMRSNLIMLSKVFWFKSNLDRIFPLVQQEQGTENQIIAFEMCSICHDELRVSRRIAFCGHRYHIRCLFNWIQSQATPQCPLCRTDIHGLYFKQSGFHLVLSILKSSFQLLKEKMAQYMKEWRVRKVISQEVKNQNDKQKEKIIEGVQMKSNIQYEVKVNDLRKETIDKKGVEEEDIDEFI